MTLLLTLLVITLGFFVAWWIIGQMSLKPPADQVLRVIAGVIMLLILFGLFTGQVPMLVWR